MEFRKSELYSLGNRSGNTEVEFRKSELYSLGNSSCRASSTWDRGARKSGDGTEEVTGVEMPRKYFRDDVARKVIYLEKNRWRKKQILLAFTKSRTFSIFNTFLILLLILNFLVTNLGYRKSTQQYIFASAFREILVKKLWDFSEHFVIKQTFAFEDNHIRGKF